jgi:hypothetical protein
MRALFGKHVPRVGETLQSRYRVPDGWSRKVRRRIGVRGQACGEFVVDLGRSRIRPADLQAS